MINSVGSARFSRSTGGQPTAEAPSSSGRAVAPISTQWRRPMASSGNRSSLRSRLCISVALAALATGLVRSETANAYSAQCHYPQRTSSPCAFSQNLTASSGWSNFRILHASKANNFSSQPMLFQLWTYHGGAGVVEKYPSPVNYYNVGPNGTWGPYAQNCWPFGQGALCKILIYNFSTTRPVTASTSPN
jgi:hypothetical protein